MENFSDVAKSAWITDDGSAVFCVPMASVIHGFFYNKDIFDEYGLEEPTTEEEFMPCSTPSRQTATSPLVMGTVDQWEVRHHGLPEYRPQLLEG